jgi:hypothetical protein
MRVTGEDSGALLLQRQAMRCILYCENCCGGKFLKMFLLEICIHKVARSVLDATQRLYQFECTGKALEEGELAS